MSKQKSESIRDISSKRIIFIGLGELGAQVFDGFLHVPREHRFLVGGRNVAYLQYRTNVSLFSALQLGYYPRVSCIYLDFNNLEQTAETIEHFRPDIIFCAATTQPWRSIYTLPQPFLHVFAFPM